MGRSPCCEKSHTNKGAWTKEEDQKLIDYINLHGEGRWRSLPISAGLLRCGKSCRLRWINYLRPDLKRGNFTDEEDELIIKLHSLLGNKWSLIAGRLPGRTDNEIKNYWNTYIKRKLLRRGIDPKTHQPIFKNNSNSSSSNGSSSYPEIINGFSSYPEIINGFSSYPEIKINSSITNQTYHLDIDTIKDALSKSNSTGMTVEMEDHNQSEQQQKQEEKEEEDPSIDLNLDLSLSLPFHESQPISSNSSAESKAKPSEEQTLSSSTCQVFDEKPQPTITTQSVCFCFNLGFHNTQPCNCDQSLPSGMTISANDLHRYYR